MFWKSWHRAYLDVSLLCILFSNVASNGTQQSNGVSFLSELFQTDPVPTEYLAFKLLEKQPVLDRVYVAIPWAVLINTKSLNRIPPITVHNGFTVCQHIHFKQIIPILKKMGITTLFTPHATKSEPDESGVAIVPFPHCAINGIGPAKVKDVYYSFIGANNHPVKKKLFEMSHLPGAVIKERKYWHFARDFFSPGCISKEQQEQERLEYQDILARSRYSLCPRGTGPSSIRFWESLQAGAIPILISDEMALPLGFDWRECIIKVSENKLDQLSEMLENISQEKESSMRLACLRAYQLFSSDNFVRSIRLYYEHERGEL